MNSTDAERSSGRWGQRGDQSKNQQQWRRTYLIAISATTIVVQMTEIGRRHIVEHAADVASPSSAVVVPGDVRVDVRAAALAADDAR